MIEISEVRYRYDTLEALRGVSLTVRKQEIFGLLGPNGSGKTTLFRLLATLLPQQQNSGSIRLFERELREDVLSIRRRIGVVFQAPSLDKKLTVGENLVHQGHLYGLKGSALKQRIDELLQQFSLQDRVDDYVEKLSGGQKRRVDLARGMLHKPVLLLLDEPSTGLDPGARLELMKQLERLTQNEGVTCFLTTHSMDEAAQCSRLGIMHRGELVAIDTPGRLKAQIGADVLLVETAAPQELAGEIAQALDLKTEVFQDAIRIEAPNGYRLCVRIAERFGNRIRGIRVGQPTLEDVFLRLTGQRFER